MNSTVTVDDVKRIYAENLARQKSPAEARQGTRTEVHGLIHVQNPMPLLMAPPSRTFNVSGITVGPIGFKVHDPVLAKQESDAKSEDFAARKAALYDRLNPEQMIASEKARSAPGANHADAVHHVQKIHGQALWAETDRLVSAALGDA